MKRLFPRMSPFWRQFWDGVLLGAVIAVAVFMVMMFVTIAGG